MENNNETNKVASVEPGEIVSVPISGDFYYRLQALFVSMTGSYSQERVADILSKIEEKKTTEDLEAFHVETMISLLCSIEQKFKEEGKIVMKDINPTLG